MLSQT